MTRPLRVVSVCRNLPTPDDPTAGVFVLNRIAAMARQSQLQAIQPLPYLPPLKALPAWARRGRRTLDGVVVEPAPMFYLPGLLKSLDGRWLARAVQPIVRRLHDQQPIDLLDAHFGYPDGLGCVRIARRLGIPVFITVRGVETDQLQQRFIAPQLSTALRQATGCIAVSHTLAALLQQHGVDPDRVRVVHNAIDQNIFKPGDMSAARARLGLHPDRPLIVSVGRLVSLKRHHVLIEAFARVRDSVPTAVLAIVGGASFEPQYPHRLLKQARALGLTESVKFIGNLPPLSVVDWLRAANLFALLSEREGCCNAVLEALAVGAPSIVTPAGDNEQFVSPGVNGDLAPVDDAAAAAAVIGHALRRKDWDREMIARRLTRQVGDWAAVAGRVLEFFEQRIQRHRPAAHSGEAFGDRG